MPAHPSVVSTFAGHEDQGKPSDFEFPLPWLFPGHAFIGGLMRIRHDRLHLVLGTSILFVWLCSSTTPSAQAACGATTCFLVIPSQQVVPLKGLLTVNAFYNYTPQRLPNGVGGVIPDVNTDLRRMTLFDHRELRTITQTYTLDLNYGLTDRFGVQLTLPYLLRTHHHAHGSEVERFADRGIGDVRVTLKYNVLPTVRSMVITGVGIELPTGDSDERTGPNSPFEPPLQLGRGNVGLVGSVYQTYELMPHRLNQFALASYRHTFRNNAGYQFGDEYLLNVGFNLVTVPWLVLTSQLNYRYLTHDNVSAFLRTTIPGVPGHPVIDPLITDRRVPNTGSTFLAYTPGLLLNLGETTQLYFYSQIPVMRDFNGNLAQDVSFVFGLTKYFSTARS
jgi:hypothetical protein